MVYRHMRGVQIAAVCDINEILAKQKAREWRAERVFMDYRSMLDLDLDLVDIVTPTTTHKEIAKLALESGKDVLVEKPMALTSVDCEEMINVAKKSGRTLCVFHGLKFLDSIKKTKATLDKEGLSPSRVRFSYFFAQPYPGFTPAWVFKEEAGGILWEALVHHIYLIEHFLGKSQTVYAIANKFRKPVHDSLTLILHSNGRPAICEYEWEAKETQRMFQLMTTTGDRFDLDLSHDFLRRKSRKSGNRWRTAYMSLSDDFSGPVVKWGQHIGNFLKARSYQKGLPMEKSYFALIGQFLSFIAGEAPNPPTTPEEGLQTIKVLEAARKSIETGMIQSL